MMPALDRIAEIRARFGAGGVSSPPSTTAFASTLADANAALNVSTAASGSLTGTSASGTNDLTAQLTSMLTAANGLNDASRAALTRLLTASGTTTTASAASTSASSSSGASARAVTAPSSYDDWASTIGDIATEEGVPASLLGALVWSESSFNPDAVSSAGARGLAQLMPSTATGLGVDIDNPIDNLRGGARYLRQMLDRFGRTDLALAAYNAGPGAVERAGGVPAYPETQNYVATVLGRAQTLAGTNA